MFQPTQPTQAATAPPPVVPEEAIIGDAPAKALDPLVGEQSILDKARDMAKPYVDKVDQTARPYVEKVAATTRPYTDAAVAKAHELVDKMDGVPVTGSQVMPTGEKLAAERREAGLESTTSTSTISAAAPTTASGGDMGAQAKGMLDQVTSAVSSTFISLTTNIEERTTTAEHPGIITQVTNAVNTGIGKVEGFIDQQSAAAGITPAPGAVDGGTPAVQTTTNQSPHPVQPL